MILTNEEEFIKNNEVQKYNNQKVQIKCDNCKKDFTGWLLTFLPKDEHLCNSCNQKRIAYGKKKENNNPTHKKFWLEQGLSEEDAERKVRERFPRYIDYWLLKGFSREEAEQMKRKQDTRNMWNSEYITERDGISLKDSCERVKKEKEKVSIRTKKTYTKEQTIICKEYWIKKGYSLEDAKKKVLEIQHERHSKRDMVQDGKKMAEAMMRKSLEERLRINEKRRKTVIEKFGGEKYVSPVSKYYWIKQGFSEEEAKFRAFEIRAPDAISGKNISSKVEERFFQSLLQITNNEFSFKRNAFLSIKKVFRRFVPDIRYKNLIIEFQGTTPHLDPRFYDISSKNPWGKSFEDVRKQDEDRKRILEENGYKVLEVWEYDFINNQKATLEIVKKALEEYREKYEKN